MNIQLLHPKHWPTWFFLGILYLLVQLPYRWQLGVGRTLGRLAYWILPRRRHIAATNLKLCFPHLSDQARNKLLKQHFESVGISVLETGMAWWMPTKQLQSLVHFEGLEHIETALQKDQGILLLSPHFTSLDLVGHLMGLNFPFYAVYREQKNAVIDSLLKNKRQQSLLKLLHRHNVRAIINTLKTKQMLWYAPDQDYGRKYSVFAPFFGVTAATITTPSRYSKISNAIVITAAFHRKQDGSGYRITFNPPLENFPSEDEQQDATRLNQLFEAGIREAPAQYLWIHRRFKTRPTGEPGFY